jgi:hypothetical protein
MTYLKDVQTEAVRKFDETIPKEARKIKIFKKARLYGVSEEIEGSIEAIGRRWEKTTKAEWTRWVKSTKTVEVKSTEVD